MLDRFDWVGFERHPTALWRILGGILMVAGVSRVAVFWTVGLAAYSVASLLPRFSML